MTFLHVSSVMLITWSCEFSGEIHAKETFLSSKTLKKAALREIQLSVNRLRADHFPTGQGYGNHASGQEIIVELAKIKRGAELSSAGGEQALDLLFADNVIHAVSGLSKIDLEIVTSKVRVHEGDGLNHKANRFLHGELAALDL